MKEHINYRINLYQRIITYITDLKKEIMIVWWLQFFLMLLSLCAPFFYKIFVDDVLIGKNQSRLYLVIGGMLAVFLFQVIIGKYNVVYGEKLKYKSVFTLQNRILNNFMNDDKYTRKNVGELKQTIENDVNQISDFLDKQVIQYMMQILNTALILIFLCFINVKLALVCIILLFITFLVDYYLAKKENGINDRVHYLEYTRHDFFYNCLINYKEIKTLNLEKRMRKLYINWLHKWAKFNLIYLNNAVLKDFVMPKVKELLLGRILIYILGGWMVMKGQTTIGGLLIFAQYYYTAIKNIESLSETEFSIEQNKVFYNQVLEALEVEEASDEPLGALDRIQSIKFKDVGFSYDVDDEFALKHINFDLKSGEKVAIVGESGGGKSTIVSLLLNQYTPKDGEIFINGMPSKEWNKKSFYQKVGVIKQDSQLLNLSIRDNLLLGRPEASDEEMKEALKMAGIYDDVIRLKEGVNTVVGEKGITFSGGQRQRLLLARIFLRDPQMYLFDEATSSLDHYSEGLIKEAVTGLGKDKMVILITHKMTLAKAVDKIYVTKNGKIEAEGTHESLLFTSDYYKTLYEKQQI